MNFLPLFNNHGAEFWHWFSPEPVIQFKLSSGAKLQPICRKYTQRKKGRQLKPSFIHSLFFLTGCSYFHAHLESFRIFSASLKWKLHTVMCPFPSIRVCSTFLMQALCSKLCIIHFHISCFYFIFKHFVSYCCSSKEGGKHISSSGEIEGMSSSPASCSPPRLLKDFLTSSPFRLFLFPVWGNKGLF